MAGWKVRRLQHEPQEGMTRALIGTEYGEMEQWTGWKSRSRIDEIG